MGRVALDQNRTIDGIKAEVDRILSEAARLDEEEDRLYGPDRRGDELPVELSKKESRLARLRDAMQRLEEKQQGQKLQDREEAEEAAGQKKRGRKPKRSEEVVEKEAKANTTDPDSRILKTRRRMGSKVQRPGDGGL